MAQIDRFAIALFEEAKRFLEKAKSEATEEGKIAYLNATLLIGVCALEAHVNAIADEMLMREDLNVLERSILSETEYELQNGEFVLRNRLKMYRLLERVQFIHRRFGNTPLDTTTEWWTQVDSALRKRNALVHPKGSLVLSEEMVEDALRGILGILDALYIALYKTHYPALGRQMDSIMTF